MSRVAVHAVRMAGSNEAGQASEGSVGKYLAMSVLTITTVDDSFVLPAGATGWLLKGVEDMVVARSKGGAADDSPTETDNQVLVMEGETVYIPGQPGKALSLIAFT